MVHSTTTFTKGDRAFVERFSWERALKTTTFSAPKTTDAAIDQAFGQFPLKI
jgi:hypothetical protein